MLLVFDVDGTLAPYGMPIEASVANYLCDLETAGHIVCIASGKDLYYLEALARGIGLRQPLLIGENGAVYKGTDRVLHYAVPRPTELKEIQAKIDDNFQNIKYQPNQINLTIFPLDAKTFEDLAQYTKKLAEQYDRLIFFVHADAIEFVPENVCKALALKRLKEELKISDQKTICIGDGDNDACLADECGLMIVVGNGLKQLSRCSRVDNIHKAIELIKQQIQDGFC